MSTPSETAAKSSSTASAPGAAAALGLLLAINMFNYIDRQILAAVEPAIQREFFRADNPRAEADMGWLATAFIVSYLLMAPLFGWLADRMSRWLIVGVSVILWSLASGASGLAGFFMMLLITRLFVGIGEAGYGPSAPTIISDLFPVNRRGRSMAWFYAAIPVGSALGYVLGGQIANHFGWRAAFYAVVPPGILLGVWCLFMKDPPRGRSDSGIHSVRKPRLQDYLVLLKTPSYVLATLGMTAMTFALGGIGFWIPKYFVDHRHAGNLAQVNSVFGIILVVGGLTATLAGGWAGDRLLRRYAGAYFIVSAAAILLSCPFIIAMIYVPFPWAWVMVSIAVFCLFFNTGPSNTILANVTHPSVRATGFAVNIFAIHILGDALSPPLLGWIGHHNWNAAFIVVAAVVAFAGAIWFSGARFLKRDMEQAAHRLD